VNFKQNILKYMQVYIISFSNEENGLSVETPQWSREGEKTHEIKRVYFSNSIEHDPEVSFDLLYLKEQYHLELSDLSVNLFLTYRNIWKEFLNSPEEYCLIKNENVQLTALHSDIEEELKTLPADWSILFPYDKKGNQLDKILNRELHWASSILLEFYLNSAVYLINKQGAAKLLNIKRIPQPVYEKITVLTEENTIAAYFRNMDWFKQSFSATLLQQRKDKTKNIILNFKAWDNQNRALVRKLLGIISDTAISNNIDLILHVGSLLGYIWYGEIIPWDDDVDIAIDERQIDNFLMTAGKVPGIKWISLIEKHRGFTYYKLWLDEGVAIPDREYKFPFIDLWLYKAEDQRIVFRNGQSFPNALQQPFKNIFFEGAAYKIPHNPLECLDSIYKRWRSWIRIDPWSHRLETVANFPLEMEIEVDQAGRIML
jgi:hypothetical protein